HACEERGVVERRCNLADASADRLLEPTVEDLWRGDEPALGRPLAERLVERERLARFYDRPVEHLRRSLDVRDARLATRVVGRELRDALADVELLGVLSRQGGRRGCEPREMGRGRQAPD